MAENPTGLTPTLKPPSLLLSCCSAGVPGAGSHGKEAAEVHSCQKATLEPVVPPREALVPSPCFLALVSAQPPGGPLPSSSRPCSQHSADTRGTTVACALAPG